MENQNVKVVLVGESNAGKTALLHRFANGEFGEEKKITIGMDFYSRPYKILNGRRVTLQIWDTAGQERFKQLMPCYLRDAQVVIIVFDLTDPEAHLHVTKWVNFVDLTRGKATHLVLVGNKADLKGTRRPSNAALLKLTTELSAIFVETSALTGENVEELFDRVAHLSFTNSPKTPCDAIRLDRSPSLMRSRAHCAC